MEQQDNRGQKAMTQHTPGPWDDQYPQHSPGEIHIYGADGNIVGSVWGIENDAQKDTVSVANARLIAAAPELLEALKGLCNTLREYSKNRETPQLHGPVCVASEQARAAIAKAEVTP